MAKMVRGMTVPDATELLRNTSKKSARLFEAVLRSAVANAEHNFKQNAQSMILKTVVVTQGTAYRRGTPMARGRVRPLRKFLCHIAITLGFPGETKASKSKTVAPKVEAKPVKKPSKKVSAPSTTSK